jgi:hypothetical protein
MVFLDKIFGKSTQEEAPESFSEFDESQLPPVEEGDDQIPVDLPAGEHDIKGYLDKYLERVGENTEGGAVVNDEGK